jgi:hypothetical protein
MESREGSFMSNSQSNTNPARAPSIFGAGDKLNYNAMVL